MHHVRLLVVVVIIGLAGGCAGPVKAWQSSLEHYVAVEGHGECDRKLRVTPDGVDRSSAHVSRE